MKRRLMSRKRAKSGVKSTARNLSGNLTSAHNRNLTSNFIEDAPLNISSNPQMQSAADQRKTLASAANHNRTASLNDSLLQGA